MIDYIENHAEENYAYYHIFHTYKKEEYEIMYKDNIWSVRLKTIPYSGFWIKTENIIDLIIDLKLDIRQFEIYINNQVNMSVAYLFSYDYNYERLKKLLEILSKEEIRLILKEAKDSLEGFQKSVQKFLNKPDISLVNEG